MLKCQNCINYRQIFHFTLSRRLDHLFTFTLMAFFSLTRLFFSLRYSQPSTTNIIAPKKRKKKRTTNIILTNKKKSNLSPSTLPAYHPNPIVDSSLLPCFFSPFHHLTKPNSFLLKLPLKVFPFSYSFTAPILILFLSLSLTVSHTHSNPFNTAPLLLAR